MKVQILNEVPLRQVVRKRVSFQDRKNENTPKLPSIEIWHLSSILTLLEINLSHLQHLLNNLSRPLKIIFVFFFNSNIQNFLLLTEVVCWTGGQFLRNLNWCSLRKHPFLLALRRWGRFARTNVVPPRKTSPAAKSEEKRMFSQATIDAVLSGADYGSWFYMFYFPFVSK